MRGLVFGHYGDYTDPTGKISTDGLSDPHRRAARLLRAGMALRAGNAIVVDPPEKAIAERLIAETRARLAPEIFEAAWAEGQAMSMDEAIAYALEEEIN